MRVLQSGIYQNFIQDQSAAKKELDRLTTQISSGKKIEHSYEDESVYVDTLRLDSEINGLKGIQDRTTKSKVITDATDSALNDFDLTLIDFKSKLILAANGTLNDENRKGVAEELTQMKEHLKNLANSSVNGQYLFSGTAVNVKPIDDEGNYQGNDKQLKTLVGESIEVPYSIDGHSLFLGVDQSINKSVSSNVHLQNLTTDKTLKSSDSVKDLMGSGGDAYFYLKGVGHDGKSFKEKLTLSETDTISTLINKIEGAYGEDNVSASLLDNGTIMIVDKKSGNSKLDFQMIASNENVSDTASLTTKIAFTKSANSSEDDKAYFRKNENVLLGNIALLSQDGVASPQTTLKELAGGQSQSGKVYKMDIKDVNGVTQNVSLNLSNSSTFTVGGNTYNIYDADDTNGATVTSADDFTLGQLENIISMAMSGKSPTSNSKAAYDVAVMDAKKIVDVGLDSSGGLKIEDKSGLNNDIAFSLYDQDSSDFTKPSGLSFMGNRAVIVDNPKIDFFHDLDTIIESVKSGSLGVDANADNPENPGLESAISRLDTLSGHFSQAHTKIGAMSNNLQLAHDKASTLELNVTQLKSEVSDVDIAEAIVQYEQVSLNYQAMMSTIAKVNSLSLLNYLK